MEEAPSGVRRKLHEAKELDTKVNEGGGGGGEGGEESPSSSGEDDNIITTRLEDLGCEKCSAAGLNTCSCVGTIATAGVSIPSRRASGGDILLQVESFTSGGGGPEVGGAVSAPTSCEKVAVLKRRHSAESFSIKTAKEKRFSHSMGTSLTPLHQRPDIVRQSSVIEDGSDTACDVVLETTEMPRGGVSIHTEAAGVIQVGIPPETIKDSMSMGQPVAEYFVVTPERFSQRLGHSIGINVAEFEFPAYFNFFVKQRCVTLIVDSQKVEDSIRAVFQETLFGPAEIDNEQDFTRDFPDGDRPDIAKELGYFRMFGKTLLSIDMLLKFKRFDENGRCVIEGADGAFVAIEKKAELGGQYNFTDSRKSESGAVTHLGRVSISQVVKIPELPPRSLGSSYEQFRPPIFGVTVLGNSHGFDPTGSTSGYVLWINKRGIMIDPPPYSSILLEESNIPDSLIDGVIVTHCHADHDAGTFQKILLEGRVMLMTTRTIHDSFIRKYSNLSDIKPDIIQNAFWFRPVQIGQPVKFRGARLEFFYSLHSIPCIGFEIYFGGKSMVFTADHMNDPARIRQMHADGIVSDGRRDRLLNFPWHHDIIMHECGVPPIHTPVATLDALPDDVKERLYICHVAGKDIANFPSLKVAPQGVENTLIMDVELPDNSLAMYILDLLYSIDLFSSLSCATATELLEIAETRFFPKGTVLQKAGTRCSEFSVIGAGVAEKITLLVDQPKTVGVGEEDIRVAAAAAVAAAEEPAAGSESGTRSGARVRTISGVEKFVQQFTVGDWFGEMSILPSPAQQTCSYDVVALTDVELVTFCGSNLRWILNDTDIRLRVEHLFNMESMHFAELLESNSMLKKLSRAQKGQLASFATVRRYAAEETVWSEGDPAEFMLLVHKGGLHYSGLAGTLVTTGALVTAGVATAVENGCIRVFEQGAFIGDVAGITTSDGTQSFTLKARTDCVTLQISRETMMHFFKCNPGVLLASLTAKFIV